MRIRFTSHPTKDIECIDGVTFLFKDGGVLDMFIFKSDEKGLFEFLNDEKDWMFRLWIFNVQFTDKESFYNLNL